MNPTGHFVYYHDLFLGISTFNCLRIAQVHACMHLGAWTPYLLTGYLSINKLISWQAEKEGYETGPYVLL